MRQLAGLLIFVFGFLLATSAPQNVYRWTHRDGYRRDTVTILGETRRRFRVQLASDQAILSVKRDRIESPSVWYNPHARLTAGIVLFDERVLAPAQLPASGSVVFWHVTLTVVLMGSGLWMFLKRR